MKLIDIVGRVLYFTMGLFVGLLIAINLI